MLLPALVALLLIPPQERPPRDHALGDNVTLTMPIRWVERPTAEDMQAAMEAQGDPDGRGIVHVQCTLWNDGRLRYCSFREDPAVTGGYVPAAQLLIPLFRAEPIMPPEGAGSHSRVSFSLDFGGAGRCLPPYCSITPSPPPPPPPPPSADGENAPAPTPAQFQAGSLGVAFDHAEGLDTRPCEGEAPKCVKLVDPAAGDGLGDLYTVQVFDEPLEAVAAREAGFERGADGRLMTTYGRFEPVEVEAFHSGGLDGLRAVVTCGISDPETGFHAAAGECLWVVMGDGQRTVVIASSGYPDGLDAAATAVASMRFLPDR